MSTAHPFAPTESADALRTGLALVLEALQSPECPICQSVQGSAPGSLAQALASLLQPSLLRLPDVLCRVGIKESYWRELINAGDAPAPVKIGAVSLWDSREITRFIEARVLASRQPTSGACNDVTQQRLEGGAA